MRFGIEHKRVDRFLIFNEMGPQAKKHFNEFKILIYRLFLKFGKFSGLNKTVDLFFRFHSDFN